MATFEDKLKEAMGERGYDSSMRRSVQTVILYEANRMIKEKLLALRPFQRKLAFFDQAKALVEALDCIPAHYQEELLWRTASSREEMESETAWKRMKMIEKDVEKMAEKVKPFCDVGKDHSQVCDEYVQHLFEKVSGEQGRCPPEWAHAHNNLIMAYRMYYNGAELDPDFPEPGPPKEIVVPATKPKPTASSSMGSGSPKKAPEPEIEEPAEQRRQIIEEVGHHLKLLQDFAGSVPAQLLDKRKRELFEALPSAPPSRSERQKQLRRAKHEEAHAV